MRNSLARPPFYYEITSNFVIKIENTITPVSLICFLFIFPKLINEKYALSLGQ